MPNAFRRTDRVGDAIQNLVGQFILRELNDKRMRLVTITGVKVSPDMGYATIYAGILNDDEKEIKAIIQSLNRVAKHFRFLLGKELTLRITPELRFVYDETSKRATRVTQLIDEAIKKIPPESQT